MGKNVALKQAQSPTSAEPTTAWRSYTINGTLISVEAHDATRYKLTISVKGTHAVSVAQKQKLLIGIDVLGELPANIVDFQTVKAVISRGEVYTVPNPQEYQFSVAAYDSLPIVKDAQPLINGELAANFAQVDVGTSEAPDWPTTLGKTPFTPVQVPMPEFFLEEGSTQPRIGYTRLTVPIMYVQQSRNSHVMTAPGLRQTTTLKKGTGRSYETYTISYIADGPQEIQENVVSVLNQITLTPFLSVEGGPFPGPYTPGQTTLPKGAIPYNAIAVRNFSISTVEGYPNQLAVNISFDPFLWDLYTPPIASDVYPRYNFDDMLCWPLFKIWCETRSKLTYSGKPFNGNFSYYIPEKNSLDELMSIISAPDISSSVTDADTYGMLSQVASDKDPFVTSRYLRKIQVTSRSDGEATYALKVNNAKAWEELRSRLMRGNTSECPIVGYCDWSIVEAQGVYTTEGVLGDTIVATVKSDQYIDGARSGADLDEGIKDLVISQLPTGLSSTAPNVLTDIASRQKNKYRYFAFVIKVGNGQQKKELAEALDELVCTDKGRNYLTETSKEKIRKLAQSTEKDVTKNSFGPNVVIEKITGSKGHNLATINTQTNPLPMHQYTGGLDGVFVVEGKCFGIDAKQRVESLKNEFDKRAMQRKSTKMLSSATDGTGVPFVALENELFALLGVYYVIPISLSMQSVDGQPDVWSFSITLSEFDPTILRNERLTILKTKWAYADEAKYGASEAYADPLSHPFIQRGEEWLEFNNQLASYDTYADLQLPSHTELKMWIGACQKFAQIALDGYSSKKTTFNLAVAIAGDKKLTANEKAIYPYVSEFYTKFPSSIKEISTWDPNVKDSRFDGPPDVKVDPDFYCYYNLDSHFDKEFDYIVECTHGKPGKKLDTSSNNPLVPQLREIDEVNGTTCVIPSDFFNTAHAADLTGVLRKTNESLRSDEHGAAMADKAEAAARKMANETAGKWWKDIGDDLLAPMGTDGAASKTWLDSRTNQTKMTLQAYPQFDQPVLNEEASDELGGQTRSQYITNMTGYLDPEWRRQFVYKIGNLYKNTSLDVSLNIKMNLTPTDFLFDLAKASSTSVISGPDEGLQGLLQNVNDAKYLKIIQTIINSDLTDSEEDYWRIIPWTAKTALANYRMGLTARTIAKGNTSSDYKRLGTDSEIGNVSSLPISERVAKIFPIILKVVGNDYNNGINPDVLASILYTRDCFGGNMLTDGKGLGKMDAKMWSPEEDNAKGYYQTILRLKAIYARELQKYKYPVFAVAATQMVITPQSQSEYSNKASWVNKGTGNLSAEADALMEKYVARYESGDSTVGLKAVQEMSQKFGIGTILKMNAVRYYQWCRAMGSLVATKGGVPTRDMFFDPGHRLITMDNPNAYAENNPSDGVLRCDTFSPDGTTMYIGLGNKVTEPYPFNSLAGDDNITGLPATLADKYEKKVAVAMTPLDEANIWSSYQDFRTYGNYWRLIGAFPSFLVAIINEGFYWGEGNKRLWDQYFLRGGISALEVFKTRKDATSSCSVTFSNLFYTLSALAQQDAYGQEVALAISKHLGDLDSLVEDPAMRGREMLGEIMNEAFFKNVPEDAKKIWYNNQLKQIVLGVGARLHVRMGYGRADKLPVVFNGTVIEAPVSEGFMTVVAAGDGSELNKNIAHDLVRAQAGFAYQGVGALGIGKDPSAIITESMISAGLGDYLFEGNFRDRSQGVQHFGEVVFALNKHYPAEMQLNIYSSSNTKLEQSLPMFRNYFNLNALVNYDEVNLFGVQVKEPTVWKVANVCRHACLDFVADALPFCTRSTLFFGKWWWPYNYEYDQSIMGIKETFGGIQNTIASDSGLKTAKSEFVKSLDGAFGKGYAPRIGALERPVIVLRGTMSNDLLTFVAPVGQGDQQPEFWSNFWGYITGQNTAGAIQQFGTSLKGYRTTSDGRQTTVELVFRNNTKEYNEANATANEIPRNTSKLLRYELVSRKQLSDEAFFGIQILDGQAYDKIEDELQQKLREKWGSTYSESRMSAGTRRMGALNTSSTGYEDLTPGEAALTWGVGLREYSKEVKGEVIDWFHPLVVAGRDGTIHGYTKTMEEKVGKAMGAMANKNDAYAGLLEFVTDLTGDASLLASFCKWKTYQQGHLISSSLNLVNNEIYADKSQVYTDAYATYTYNGPLSRDSIAKTIFYSADSIPGYTPVTIKDHSGQIDILPIEDLWPEDIVGNEKQYKTDLSYQIWDKTGWVEPIALMAHQTHKKIYAVNGHNGFVEVTEDHSVMTDGIETKPLDCLGKTIEPVAFCDGGDLVLDNDIAFFYGMFVAEGTAGVYSVGEKQKRIYQFKVVNQDLGLLEKAEVGLRKLGYPTKISKYPSDCVYSLSTYLKGQHNSLKIDLVNEIVATCYTKRKEKRIPKAILNADLETQKAFLDGFYAGDGIKGRAKHLRDMGRPYHAFESRDCTLIAQLAFLVSRCLNKKVVVDYTIKPRSRGPVSYYKIRVLADRGQGIMWKRPANVVKRVELAARQEEIVYDFQTKSGTFCAGINNILVHNTDILGTDRRTMAVDTGIYTTLAMEGDKRVKSFFTGWVPGIGEGVNGVETVPAVYNSVISSLAESLKDMYQGWLTAVGCTAIKPRDLVYLNDAFHSMSGPIFVKEVLHRMDAQTGLVTMVSPDACVFNQASYIGQNHVAKQVSFFTRFNGVITYKVASAAIYGVWKQQQRNRSIRAKSKGLAAFDLIDIAENGTDEQTVLALKGMLDADNGEMRTQLMARWKEEQKSANEAITNYLSKLTDDSSANTSIRNQLDAIMTSDPATASQLKVDLNTYLAKNFDRLEAEDLLQKYSILLDQQDAIERRFAAMLDPTIDNLADALEGLGRYNAGAVDQLNEIHVQLRLVRQKIANKRNVFRLMSSARPTSRKGYFDLLNGDNELASLTTAEKDDLVDTMIRTQGHWDKAIVEGKSVDEVKLIMESEIAEIKQDFYAKNKVNVDKLLKAQKLTSADEKDILKILKNFSPETRLTDDEIKLMLKGVYNELFFKSSKFGLFDSALGLMNNSTRYELVEQILNESGRVFSSEGKATHLAEAFLDDLTDLPKASVNVLKSVGKKSIGGDPIKYAWTAIFHHRVKAKEITALLSDPDKVVMDNETAKDARSYLKHQKNYDEASKSLKELMTGVDSAVSKDYQQYLTLTEALADPDISGKNADALQEAIEKLTKKYATDKLTGAAGLKNTFDEAVRTAKGVDAVTDTATQLKDLIRSMNVAKGGMDSTKAAIMTLRSLRLGNVAKDLWATAKGAYSIIKTAKATNVWAIASQVAMYFIGGGIADWINYSMKARQCVKVIPLQLGNVPWVAGMSGHQGAVLGDDPSWFDKFLVDTAKTPALALGGAILGLDIEAPDNLEVTEMDRLWKESLGM